VRADGCRPAEQDYAELLRAQPHRDPLNVDANVEVHGRSCGAGSASDEPIQHASGDLSERFNGLGITFDLRDRRLLVMNIEPQPRPRANGHPAYALAEVAVDLASGLVKQRAEIRSGPRCLLLRLALALAMPGTLRELTLFFKPGQ
jgi:hypothetical protein